MLNNVPSDYEISDKHIQKTTKKIYGLFIIYNLFKN